MQGWVKHQIKTSDGVIKVFAKVSAGIYFQFPCRGRVDNPSDKRAHAQSSNFCTTKTKQKSKLDTAPAIHRNSALIALLAAAQLRWKEITASIECRERLCRRRLASVHILWFKFINQSSSHHGESQSSVGDDSDVPSS